MWGRGPRRNNATCSVFSWLSVTSPTTHKQIGPFWCWFPCGQVCVPFVTLWVSPTDSPVRLGVSPADASTPTGVFNQRFEALFPHTGTTRCSPYPWFYVLICLVCFLELIECFGNILKYLALAGVARLGITLYTESLHSSIPGQGTCLRCGFGPHSGHVQEATDRWFSSHRCFSPSVSPSHPLFLKKSFFIISLR